MPLLVGRYGVRLKRAPSGAKPVDRAPVKPVDWAQAIRDGVAAAFSPTRDDELRVKRIVADAITRERAAHEAKERISGQLNRDIANAAATAMADKQGVSAAAAAPARQASGHF